KRRESSVHIAGKHQATRCRECPGRTRGTLAMDPDRFLRLEIDRLEESVITVRIWTRAKAESHARREQSAFAGGDRREVLTRFNQRHEEQLRIRIVRVGNPVLPAL